MDLKKAIDKVNRLALLQVLRVYDMGGAALWQMLRMYDISGKLLNGIRSMLIGFYRRRSRKWRLPDLLYADDLVICGELEEGLKAMVECFVEVYRRRGLKFSADRSKLMVLGREEGLKC